MADLVDMFERLNILSLKIQGPETTVIHLIDTINAFIQKQRIGSARQRVEPSVLFKSCLSKGREKPTSSTTRRCGMRIPAAMRSEVHVVIVVHGKHVLFSHQREMLSCTTCTLSLDEFLARVYIHRYLSLYQFVLFRNFF